jgi:hypothetical protein
VRKFIVTIEGRSWEDVAEIELPQLPGEGERIETKYGTCVVSQAEPLPAGDQYDGKIVCRFPSSRFG